MTKNQKMLLGVGAVAVVGYLLWKKQQTAFTGNAGERTFFNASGTSKIATPCKQCTTPCGPPIPYDPNTGNYAPNGVCLEVRDNPATLDTTTSTFQQHGTLFRAWRCGTCTQAGTGTLAIKK